MFAHIDHGQTALSDHPAALGMGGTPHSAATGFLGMVKSCASNNIEWICFSNCPKDIAGLKCNQEPAF
jgi:hypothetical protein